MIKRKDSRFFGTSHRAVAVWRGEDGLIALHFNDDGGIAGNFTGVEGTYANHYPNVSVLRQQGGRGRARVLRIARCEKTYRL
jgi:hypothetical protein